MNREECMLALEQMILELPQYRKITNELCNRFIPMYVRENYEQEQIYTEGNHSSSKDYCWDIYDTIPISIIEAILDNFKQQEDTEEENTNLKQALNDIRELVKDNSIEMDRTHTEVCCSGDSILQIIDKVLGDDLDE